MIGTRTAARRVSVQGGGTRGRLSPDSRSTGEKPSYTSRHSSNGRETASRSRFARTFKPWVSPLSSWRSFITEIIAYQQALGTDKNGLCGAVYFAERQSEILLCAMIFATLRAPTTHPPPRCDGRTHRPVCAHVAAPDARRPVNPVLVVRHPLRHGYSPPTS